MHNSCSNILWVGATQQLIPTVIQCVRVVSGVGHCEPIMRWLSM